MPGILGCRDDSRLIADVRDMQVVVRSGSLV